MSSKIREILPPEYNRLQQAYQQHVKFIQDLLHDRAYKITEEMIENFSHNSAFLPLLLHMVENKPSQLLLKVKPQISEQIDSTPIYQVPITRQYDLISAFYVPDDIQWVILEINSHRFKYSSDCVYNLQLEEILLQSNTVPKVDDNLEYILEQSHQTNIKRVHNREKIIFINGQKYRRLIFVHPVLPVVKLCFSQMILYTSDNRDIYLEIVTCDLSKIAQYTRDQEDFVWCESFNSKGQLVIIRGGMAFPFLDSINDEWELDERLKGVSIANNKLESLQIPSPILDTKGNFSILEI